MQEALWGLHTLSRIKVWKGILMYDQYSETAARCRMFHFWFIYSLFDSSEHTCSLSRHDANPTFYSSALWQRRRRRFGLKRLQIEVDTIVYWLLIDSWKYEKQPLEIMSLNLRSFDVSVPSPTFRIVAGLGQGLAVGQHGHPWHRDAHHAALFARLVLQRDKSQSGWDSGSHIRRKLNHKVHIK